MEEKIFKFIVDHTDNGEYDIYNLDEKIKEYIKKERILNVISLDDYYSNDIDLDDFYTFHWQLLRDKESDSYFLVLCNFIDDEYYYYLLK